MLTMISLSLLPCYMFVISIVGYCFGWLVLALVANGAKQSRFRTRALSNAATNRELLEREEAAGEESFELEKRAFFSKVSLGISSGSDGR